MHISFEKITYKNFLSVGNNPVEVDFTSHDTTLIHGTNGQGKSTLIDALHYALYGRAFRKIVNGDLINNINSKSMLVTLEFSIGNKKYKIKRGIKPNIFDIYVNKKKLKNDSSSKDFQKELEYTILKMSRDTFRQIVVLGSSAYVPFMRLTSKTAKTAIIEDLLDMQVFSKMLICLKQSISGARRRLKEVEHSMALINNSITHTTDHIKDIQKNNDQLQTENLDNIQALLKQIDGLMKNRGKVADTLTRIVFDEDKQDEREDAINEVSKSIHSLDLEVRNTKKELAFFQENHDCPSCEQPISTKLKDTKTTNLSSHVDILKNRKTRHENIHTKLERKIQQGIKKRDAIVELNRDIKQIDRKVAELNASVNNLKDMRELDTTHLEVKIAEYNKNMLTQQESYSTLVETVQEYLIIQEMLNETGIKSQIVKTYIPILNSLIEKYLDVLEFDAQMTFDEMFNETIKMHGRDSVTYFGLSEGQKMRIDLCLLFVFKDISRLKNSTSANLLIFDEIGDSSLDNEGFEAFLRIIDDAATQGNNIFIISHNSELQATDRLSRSIEFKKVSNFTQTIQD